MAEDLLEEAQESHENTSHKARLFSEGLYKAGSWERARRVVYKAEAMEKGTNTRFVVTTRNDEPKALYEFYARRGAGENWIKDFKLHVKADRLSCHRFMANQFRLLLHAAAYWLMDALRRKLIERGSRRMQLDTLRLRLIKNRWQGQGTAHEGPPASGFGPSGTMFMARSFGSLRRHS
jgi:hypothetical protein